MDDDMSTEKVVAAARKLQSQVMAAPRGSSRTRSPLRSGRTDSDPDSESSRASSTSRGKTRGRSRGTGITRARADLRGAREEAKEEAFNQSLRDRVCRSKVPEFILDFEEVTLDVQKDDPKLLSVEELRAAAGKNVATIVQVATTSGKLKGTLTKLLKDSATALQEMVDALASRTEADETRRLKADNVRLRHEVENLKADLKAHLREFSDMKTTMAAANTTTASILSGDNIIEDLKASIVSSVGIMLDARFAAIEERLLPEKVLRPPLAADARRQAMPVNQPTTATSTARTGPGTRSATGASSSNETSEAAAGSSQTNTTENSDWVTVVKRGKKKKKTPTPTTNVASTATPATKSTQPAAPKLASPKTAAVVVTLQPEAAEKGVTYAQILERAEQCVNLQELGISEGMKIRRAATGARVLELPKGQTPEQAELLANRLRTALDGVANVVRPTKSATLRVTGLDDSITTEKIITAVARAGNCPPQLVKVGEVLSGSRGMGIATVHCPTEVAKVLSDAGKLLVGWSSAKVWVLEQRPLRYFRCLGIGHTRPTCSSTVDRGDLCFRCSCSGHRSSGCVAPMRCLVCADAGLPSEHMMGGKRCNPPPTKGRMYPLAQGAAGAGCQTQEENEMMS